MTDSALYDREGPTRDARGPGWTVKTNSRGIVVSRIRFFEHEDRRDPAWEKRERVRLGSQDFELQQGETYEVPVGLPYYQTFAARTRKVGPWQFEGYYVRDAPAIFPRLPVILGLDGGAHRPALVMAQFDQSECILWAMRELRPKNFQAGEFIALVRYLTGQATLDQLKIEERQGRWNTARAIAWVEQERRSPFYGWEMPWIKPNSGARFYPVMAKHEGRAVSQMAKDRELNSLAKLYAQQGIELQLSTEGWDHRGLVANFMLGDGRLKGTPRALFDSSCKWLLSGMAGGLVVAPPSQPTGGPKRDRKFEDTHDAWLNCACAAFPLNHADRMAALDTQHARDRAAQEADSRPQVAGLRPVQAPGPDGAAWGGIRLNYQENGHG